MVTTDDLIKNLSGDCKPVERLASPWVRTGRWFLAAVLCVGAAVAILGLRSDISMMMAEPLYIFELGLILALAVSSAVAAFLLSVPGEGQNIWIRLFPLTPIGLWILYLGGKMWMFLGEFGWEGVQMGLGIACVGDIVGLGLIPGLILFVMLRKAAPTNLLWVGVLAGLAVAGVGAFGSHLLCHKNDPFHLLLWHFLPVLAVGGIGIAIGKKALRW